MAKSKKVKLTITTDYLYTAEFLYNLAAQIENMDKPFESFEDYCGNAKIEWPEQAFKDYEDSKE